jgi:hypothetical protein
MFIGGIVRMADLATDILYYITSDFARDDIRNVMLATIVAPFGILLLVCLIGTIKDLVTGNRKQALRTFISGLLFTISDPTGITLITAAFVVLSTKADIADRTYLEILSKITGFLEALVESIPQLILQTTNNLLLGQGWTILAIFSIIFSTCSISYSLIRLLVLCDKFKQAEDVKDLEKRMAANRVNDADSQDKILQNSRTKDKKKRRVLSITGDLESATRPKLVSKKSLSMQDPETIQV